MGKGEKPHLSEVSHQMLVDIIESGTPQQYQDAIKMHLKVHLDRINNEQ
jgi:DNA-binding FadR family transcriptional regulator